MYPMPSLIGWPLRITPQSQTSPTHDYLELALWLRKSCCRYISESKIEVRWIDEEMRRILHWWSSLGTTVSFAATLLRLAVYAILLFMAFECITLPLGWPEQSVLGVPHNPAGLRYTSNLFALEPHHPRADVCLHAGNGTLRLLEDLYRSGGACNPGHGRNIGIINIGFMLVLLSAEAYAFLILFLGYIQTVRPLHRPPIPLPRNVEDWPHIDVLIPTYNEPLSVVQSTVFAAFEYGLSR